MERKQVEDTEDMKWEEIKRKQGEVTRRKQPGGMDEGKGLGEETRREQKLRLIGNK